MIDMGSGPLFPLSEVPDRVPRLRRGRKLHKSTPRRWAKDGVAGVRLWVASVGGTLCTSERALCEFFERIGALRKRGGAAPAEHPVASPRMSREDVQRRLDEIGI